MIWPFFVSSMWLRCNSAARSRCLRFYIHYISSPGDSPDLWKWEAVTMESQCPYAFFAAKVCDWNRGGEHNFCLTRCHGLSSCLSYEMHLYRCTLWAQTVCRVSIERQARWATKLTKHRKRKQIEQILVLQGVNVASDPRFPHHPNFFLTFMSEWRWLAKEARWE